jgi:predicted nucleic acid-binding protein
VILVDTTPLVALCDSRDARHAAAVKHLEALAGESFVLCAAVLTETCFHLPYRSQRRRLRILLDELDVQAAPLAEATDFWFQVFDWLAKYEDEPDFADACLAVLSGQDRALRIWTYDREFRTTWRRPNGSVIPLAVKT